MQPISRIESRSVVLAQTDIDTDQIIPARFLTRTTREGLGANLFADWRYLKDGSENPDFELNQAAAKGCEILVAGKNFGCGSSREHAPWALLDFGFRAVVSSEIADIFRNNSLKNGLLPVVIDKAAHARLLAQPGMYISIDLATCTLSASDGSQAGFGIDAFARHCLMHGIDELGFLLDQLPAIEKFESATGRAAAH